MTLSMGLNGTGEGGVGEVKMGEGRVGEVKTWERRYVFEEELLPRFIFCAVPVLHILSMKRESFITSPSLSLFFCAVTTLTLELSVAQGTPHCQYFSSTTYVTHPKEPTKKRESKRQKKT